MASSDPLGGTPAPPAPANDGRRKITCEFCECPLAPSGQYSELSEKAKMYRKLKEENEKLQGSNDTLRQENEDLKRKVSELTPAPPAAPGRRTGVVVARG
jgi:hypothetical protein